MGKPVEQQDGDHDGAHQSEVFPGFSGAIEHDRCPLVVSRAPMRSGGETLSEVGGFPAPERRRSSARSSRISSLSSWSCLLVASRYSRNERSWFAARSVAAPRASELCRM